MTMAIGLAACVFRSVEMVSVARHCGFDFLVADMEHGAMSIGEAATLCVAGTEADFPVYVRVAGSQSEYLTRAIDCGAGGLIVPHVDTAEEARGIVKKVRFQPRGRRSIPSPIAIAGFRPLPVSSLVERSEAALKVVVMIECAEGLAAAGDIAAVDGIDTIMVGANDLAQSLGRSGEVGHPEVRGAFRSIAAAAASHGKKFGVIGLPASLMQTHAIELDAAIAVVANEINLMFDAGVACVMEMRALTCQPKGILQNA